MDPLDLNENICRICLDRKVILNWNEEIFEFSGISYKDCYYKYTRLDNTDSYSYPTNLCEICAEELKNAHFLFEKALESYNVLRVAFISKNREANHFDIEVCGVQKTEFEILTYHESSSIEYSQASNPDNTLIEPLLNECDNYSIDESENEINNSKEAITIESITIEPVHFIDLQNFESSVVSPLDQTLSKDCDAELTKTSYSSKYIETTDKNPLVPKNSSEGSVNPSSECKLAQPSSKTDDKTKNCEHLSGTSMKQNLNTTSDNKSLIPSTTNPVFKRRKKYILICQYCSLKVDGTNQLKIHEATHNENRERTAICPQCGVKLYNKMALNEHMKIHDEHRQKQHKCEFCEKAFFNKGALNVHRRIHLGLMVKCQLCPKEFYRQIDLDKHLLRHSVSPLQKNVGKKAYVIQCQDCNKSIYTNKWKEHAAAHQNQPQVKCKICNKNFFSRGRCTKHLKRVHHKTLSEYEEFIHYYVNRHARITNLIMKQQLEVQPVIAPNP